MNSPPISPTVLYLYGRETCHLCHDMWADLLVYRTQNQLNFQLVWVDIEDAPELHPQYHTRIPVLTNAANEVLCEGRLDISTIRGMV